MTRAPGSPSHPLLAAIGKRCEKSVLSALRRDSVSVVLAHLLPSPESLRFQCILMVPRALGGHLGKLGPRRGSHLLEGSPVLRFGTNSCVSSHPTGLFWLVAFDVSLLGTDEAHLGCQQEMVHIGLREGLPARLSQGVFCLRRDPLVHLL